MNCKRFFFLLVVSLFFLFSCSHAEASDAEGKEESRRAIMQWVILGGPGAGKGTQARQIKEHFQIAHISTGALFRDEVARGTGLGKKVKGVMDRGELVADEIVLALVEERLGQPDCDGGFILDGFPRTTNQATGLEEILARRGNETLQVLFLKVSDEEMMRRLLLRQRADDTESTIRHRIGVYHEETDPLVEFYRKRGTLVTVNGEQPIDSVFEEVVKKIERTLAKR